MAKKLLFIIALLSTITLHGIHESKKDPHTSVRNLRKPTMSQKTKQFLAREDRPQSMRDLRKSQLSQETKQLLIQSYKNVHGPLSTKRYLAKLENIFNNTSKQYKKLETAEELARCYNDDENKLYWLITAFNLGSETAADKLEKYYHNKNKQLAATFSLFSTLLEYSESEFGEKYKTFKNEINEAIAQKNNRRLRRALDNFAGTLKTIVEPPDQKLLARKIAKLRKLSPLPSILFSCPTIPCLNPRIRTGPIKKIPDAAHLPL